MIIYSFDSVLRQQKSIHSIELTPGSKTKIALWRPVPWIGFLYFVFVELAFIIAAKMPVADVVAEMFAPLVYYVAFPIAVVWFVLRVEFDGRPPHKWLISYALYMRRPKRTLGGRPVDAAGKCFRYAGRVKIRWDLNAPRLQRGRVVGGTISTAVPAQFTYAILHGRPVLKSRGDRLVDGYEVQKKLEVRP